MLRVISGKYKNKRLINVEEFWGSRPTMDRIKESMFDILQYKIKNSKVLDLFSGTGQLGIEALSRGAKSCTFVDNAVDAFELIKKNLGIVEVKQEVLNCDAFVAIDKFASKGVKFDVIIIDPPYSSSLGIESIAAIKKRKILDRDGVIVFETDRNIAPECEKIYSNVDVRTYGKKLLIFLKED